MTSVLPKITLKVLSTISKFKNLNNSIKHKKKFLLLAVFILFAFPTAQGQDTLTHFGLNQNTSFSVNNTVGTPTATLYSMNYSNAAPNCEGSHKAIGNSDTDSMDILIDATGFINLAITWQQNRKTTGTGTPRWDLRGDFDNDGTIDYSAAGPDINTTVTCLTATMNLPASFNNQSNIKLTIIRQGGASAARQSFLDDVLILGDSCITTITCPSNITSGNDAGQCCAVVSYTVVSGNDCPGEIITQSAGLPSGSCFPLGITVNTFLVTNAAGNTATCSFTVTINDTENPNAVCQNINVYLDGAGNATITASDIDGGSTDNCGSVTLGASQTSFTCADIGINNVTLTVDDGNGNTSSCNAVVTVIDSTSPSAICQNITIYLDGAGNAIIIASDIDGGSTDNCGSVTFGASQTTFTCAHIGTNNVTLTVDDGNSNTSSCIAVVTVIDTISPSITCPANITVNNDPGQCCAVVVYGIYGADNCAPPLNFFDDFDPMNTLLWGERRGVNVNNSCGSFSGNALYYNGGQSRYATTTNINTLGGGSISFYLKAGSGSAPCEDPDNSSENMRLEYSNDFGSSWTAIATYAFGSYQSMSLVSEAMPAGAQTFSTIFRFRQLGHSGYNFDNWVIDNVSISGILPSNLVIAQLSGLASGSCFPVGTTMNTFMVTDPSGNTDSCSFTVTVIDNENPNAVCQNINVYLDGAGNATITASDIDGGSTDNCGSVTLGASQTSFTCADIGTNNVTLTVTDGNGFTSSCNAVVTVIDSTSPSAVCQNINIYLDGAGNATITASDIDGGSTDICGSVTLSASQTTFTCAHLGTNNVTLTVADGSSNTSSCTAVVTVIDTISPTITCPADITVSNDPGQCCAVVVYGIYGADNCAPALSFFDDFDPENTLLWGQRSGINVNNNCGSFSGNALYYGGRQSRYATTTTINTLGGGSISFYLKAGSGSAPCEDPDQSSENMRLEYSNDFGSSWITIATYAFGSYASMLFVSEAMPAGAQTFSTIFRFRQLGHSGYGFDNWMIDNVSISGIVSGNLAIAQLSGLASGSCFPVGTTTNVWTAFDVAGNSDTCFFTVTVLDNENPTITCPGNITANNDAGQCCAVVSYSVTATDNCPGVTVTQTGGLPSGSCFPKGTTTNTFVAVDAAGNTATCSFTVTINDTENPNAVCQNITVYLDGSGNATITASDIDGGSTDNCGSVTLSASRTAFTCADIDTNHVTLTVDDGNGNTSSCIAVVTIVDSTSPSITCPADISVGNDPGQCCGVISFAVAATDNCPGVTVSQTGGLPSDSCFPVGVTTNTFVATDASGNTKSCSFTVTVKDIEPPVITCPANITVGNDPGQCCAVVIYGLFVSDNCLGVNWTQISGIASASCFPVGTTVNVWRAIDATGNVSTCSFTVTVNDTENPTIICPGNITTFTDPGACCAVVSYTVTASDNCPGVTWSQTDGLPSGSCFPKGTTTNTFVATDAAGNTASCTFLIVVIDNEPPVITCPANLTVNNDPGQCCAVVIYGMTVSDNCPGVNWTQISGIASGSCFPVGTTTNVWRAIDAVGLVSTCSFTVTVVDNEPPVINCPANITTFTDPGACCATVSYTVTASDNCPGVTWTQTVGFPSGSCFPKGTTTNTFVATDASGNTSSCSFLIVVIDNEPPVITCPGNITVNNDLGQCCAVVSFSVTATDNCPGVTVTQISGLANGSCFPVGTTVNIFVAMDAAGLSDTCSFTVTVIDNEPPTITCPANITANNDPGQCCGTVNYTVTANDNCPGVVWVQTDGLPSGSCFQVGTTTNTFLATDAAGNTATCSFTVTINDVELSVVNCIDTVVCLNDSGWSLINLATLTGIYDIYNATQTQTGNLNDTLIFVFNGIPDDPSNGGVLRLEAFGDLDLNSEFWSIYDEFGNLLGTVGSPGTQCGSVHSDSIKYEWLDLLLWSADGSITFTAIASNNLNPTLCGSDFLSLELEFCHVSDDILYATDNCGVDTVYISDDSLTCADLGVNTIVLTAVDIHGNTSTCSAQVTVIDKTAPVVVKHPYPIFWLDTFGQATIHPNDVIISVFDNCSIDTMELDRVLLDCNDFGTILVTLTVTDGAGNTSTCTGPIGVFDAIFPIAGCKDTTLYLDINGNAWINTFDLESGSWDNCSYGVNNSLVHFNWNHLGVNWVPVLIYDPQNNQDTCHARVIILDTLNPNIFCRDTMFSNTPGLCSAFAVWPPPAASAGATVVQTGGPTSGLVLPVGVYAATYKATVPSGNSSSCSMTIIVKDDEPPVITCPSNRTRSVRLGGSSSRTVKYPAPTATDNCGVSSITHVSGGTSGSFFPVGITVVIWKATDIYGNMSTCSFTITVIAVAAPLSMEDNSMEDGASKGSDANNSESDSKQGLEDVNLMGNANALLYPNPTYGSFILELERTGFQGKLIIEIFDLLGRRIYFRADGFDNFYNLEIDLSDNSAGQYMVHLRIGDMLLTRKLVLIK